MLAEKLALIYFYLILFLRRTIANQSCFYYFTWHCSAREDYIMWFYQYDLHDWNRSLPQYIINQSWLPKSIMTASGYHVPVCLTLLLLQISSYQSSFHFPFCQPPSVEASQRHPVSHTVTVTESLNHSVTQSFSYSATQSISHWITRALGHLVTQSFSHSVTQLFGYLVSQSFSH